MLDFGGLFASVLTIFQDLFTQILGPVLELFGGIFPS
jgi:hypothetical protein